MKKYLLFWMAFVTTSVIGQNLSAFIHANHQAGCNNNAGQLSVYASGGNWSYHYLWSTGDTMPALNNLSAGQYTVIVTSGSEIVYDTFDLLPFGIHELNVQHACWGGTGSVSIETTVATAPLTYHWIVDQVNVGNPFYWLDNLSASEVIVGITDADGCTDYDTVQIIASNPQIQVYLEDSSLCYGSSTQVWFEPGYTLIGPNGQWSVSGVDTFTYVNVTGSQLIPDAAMDQFGCVTSNFLPLPFNYLQSYQGGTNTLYLINDTLSPSYSVNETPSTYFDYVWWRNSEVIDTTDLAYIVITENGNYMLEIVDGWGCSSFGFLTVNNLSVVEMETGLLTISPNPMIDHCKITSNQESILKVELFEMDGRVIHTVYANEEEVIIDRSVMNQATGAILVKVTTKNKIYDRILILH